MSRLFLFLGNNKSEGLLCMHHEICTLFRRGNTSLENQVWIFGKLVGLIFYYVLMYMRGV